MVRMQYCPVDAPLRTWLEYRWHWLERTFGIASLKRQPVVLPTIDFFPDHYEATPACVERLVQKVASYLPVAVNQVEVDYYENDNLNRQEQIDKYLVWLEIQQVVDPSSVIASAAHQLCRNKLVAERLISATEADLPYLADLASVFFGVGVVLANYSLHEQYWHQHHYGDWIIGRNTHLSMNEFGYAFGLLARVREEEKPSWLSHLRLDIRKACKKTMNWLEHQPPLQNLTSVPYPENPVKDSNHFKPSDTDRACVYCDEPIHESVSRTHSRVCANCQASIEESDAEHSSSASIEFSKLSEAYTWAIIAVVVLACIILMTVGFHG